MFVDCSRESSCTPHGKSPCGRAALIRGSCSPAHDATTVTYTVAAPVHDAPASVASDTTTAAASLVRYTYAKGSVNSVFVPLQSMLTKYNARPGVPTGGLAASANQFKPYANVCGLFALSGAADTASIAVAVWRVAREVPPSYD